LHGGFLKVESIKYGVESSSPYTPSKGGYLAWWIFKSRKYKVLSRKTLPLHPLQRGIPCVVEF
jgi:hypothetical protein